MVAMITSELEVCPSSMPMMKTRKNKMSLDKDCCLESYSEGYRNGKKDARMNPPHTADLGTRYRYRQEGAQFEKERIIEIIENTMKGCSPSSNEMFILAGLLKEIKGE
jgi:hypothetical protein